MPCYIWTVANKWDAKINRNGNRQLL
uniref:Uncharacterized protein MANES_12G100500 n=1 Tax=Rhizophora mucronata TaxID=61149 RepID=A0A2P2IQJ2_RHIMU